MRAPFPVHKPQRWGPVNPTTVSPNWAWLWRDAQIIAPWLGEMGGGSSSGSAWDFATSRLSSYRGTPTTATISPVGNAFSFSGTNQNIQWAGLPARGDADTSFACIVNFDALNTIRLMGHNLLWVEVSAAGALTMQHSGIGATTIGITVTTATPYFIAASFDALNNRTRCVVRELLTGTITTADVSDTRSVTTSNGTFQIAEIASGAADLDGQIALAACHYRSFSVAELTQWALDPYGFVRPTPRRTPTAAAGGADAVTGTDSGTLTESVTTATTASDTGTLSEVDVDLEDNTSAVEGTLAETVELEEEISQAETGTFAEAVSALLDSLTPADSGTLVEAALLGDGVVGADSGTLAEAVTTAIDLSDSGAFTESASVVTTSILTGVARGTASLSPRVAGTATLSPRVQGTATLED